jgi:broad specificity phosphatase PhoE
MPSDLHLLLVRHARSTWNAAGRWQGWADPGLAPGAKAHVADLARRLPREPWQLWSSDLRRARQTADLLAEALGAPPVRVDERLRERDLGAWSGLETSEIEARWGPDLERFRSGELERPPGGESRRSLLERVLAALDDIGATSLAEGSRPLVVTHGGVIRTLEAVLADGPAGPRTPTQVAPDGAVRSNLGGRWLERIGSTWHLGSPLPPPPCGRGSPARSDP